MKNYSLFFSKTTRNSSVSTFTTSLTFFSLYILVLLISSLFFTLYTHNLTYSLFEVASSLGNVGLTLGFINKAMPIFYKILVITLMYLGRLEIFIPLATLYYFFKKE